MYLEVELKGCKTEGKSFFNTAMLVEHVKAQTCVCWQSAVRSYTSVLWLYENEIVTECQTGIPRTYTGKKLITTIRKVLSAVAVRGVVEVRLWWNLSGVLSRTTVRSWSARVESAHGVCDFEAGFKPLSLSTLIPFVSHPPEKVPKAWDEYIRGTLQKASLNKTHPSPGHAQRDTVRLCLLLSESFRGLCKDALFSDVVRSTVCTEIRYIFFPPQPRIQSYRQQSVPHIGCVCAGGLLASPLPLSSGKRCPWLI